MTSCSTCAAQSESSWPCATSGPRRTSSRRSTTRTAPRGASPTATCTRRSCSDPAHLAHVPGAPAALPGGDRVVRPVRLRPGGVQLERLGARGDLRPVAPRTSATATTRSGTRGTTATRTLADTAHPRRGRPCAALPALAPVGLDRGAAGGPLPDQLAHHAGPHPGVLRDGTPVVYPPVETEPLQPGARWAITTWSLSELMPHKRIDVTVRRLQQAGSSAR